MNLGKISMWFSSFFYCAVCMLVLSGVDAAHAASVRELKLDEIIDSSAVAFHGICIGNRTEREAQTNLVVTYTTFDVKDVLKGPVGLTHTIKQIGGVMPDGQKSFLIHGVPTFTVGEEYVLFLAGVSKSGFSSPIGLSQGNFSVKQSAAGKTVTNGTDFRETTSRMANMALPTSDAPTRDLSLVEFKRLARTHASQLQ